VGAFGGRREIMQTIAPVGPVYQAGTLSGNPVALAAGLATLKLVQSAGFYEKLGAATRSLCERLSIAASASGVPFSANSIGGMFGLYFRDAAPQSYQEVLQCDAAMFNRFFHAMLAEGVYFAPSAYEAGFVSAAHGPAEIEKTVQAAGRVFAGIAHPL
jgi:glutamate-1-semialdehyde 2,1-aminomutase